MLVRGGELDPEVLREDAVRYHRTYGVYGISVFAGSCAGPTFRVCRHLSAVVQWLGSSTGSSQRGNGPGRRRS